MVPPASDYATDSGMASNSGVASVPALGSNSGPRADFGMALAGVPVSASLPAPGFVLAMASVASVPATGLNSGVRLTEDSGL